MPFSDTENHVKFNTKIKYYDDDFYNIIYCSRNIFKNKEWEKASKNSDLILYELTQAQRDFESETNWSLEPFSNDFVRNDFECDKKKKYNTSADNVRWDSVKRAREKIFDIVYLNEWSYFLTITFNDSIVDGSDIPKCLKKISYWLENMKKRNGLEYLLIPEFHKDNNRIHAHALINDSLNLVDSGTYIHKQFKKPVQLSTIKRHNISIDDCHAVYNVADWHNGFSTAIKLYGDKMAISRYMTKYITKDIKKIFGKFYWSSRSLKRDVPVVLQYNDFSDIPLLEYSPNGQNIAFKYKLINNYGGDDDEPGDNN